MVQTPQLRDYASALDTVVAIGDLVSRTAIEEGLAPKVIVVDYRTERKPVGDDVVAIVSGYGKNVLRVKNPAATVTNALYHAVAQSLRLQGSVRIEVDGEEDLAGLPVFAECELGTVVLYGMPGKGVVVVRVDEAMRQRARDLLAQMRVD